MPMKTTFDTARTPSPDGASPSVRDALDLRVPIARVRRQHPQQPLGRAVGRDLLGDDRGARQRAAFDELVEERPGDVAYAAKFARAAMIDPVPELRDAHIEFASGNPDLGESADDFGARSWAARAASVITGASSMRRLKPPTSSCRRGPKADGVAPNPARDRLYSLFSKNDLSMRTAKPKPTRLRIKLRH